MSAARRATEWILQPTATVAIINLIQSAALLSTTISGCQHVDLSLLLITVSAATLCTAIVMLAATSINKRRLDAMIGNKSSASLEQRLIGLSESHRQLASSVDDLRVAVNSILKKLELSQ